MVAAYPLWHKYVIHNVTQPTSLKVQICKRNECKIVIFVLTTDGNVCLRHSIEPFIETVRLSTHNVFQGGASFVGPF